MSREEIYEKLNEIFRDVFDDEGICLHDDTTANDIEDLKDVREFYKNSYLSFK